MTTASSFAPPAVLECPYVPRMTRAAALALRTAGGLKENCVVVITDGPAIGPAATVTEIELNPVSPTELGQTARVHTTYDNDAWTGIYDIDLGSGTITELTDNLGNTVKDVDSGAPTVHTQFPWGNVNFRDNYVEDCTLTGLNTQVGTWTNNRIVGCTITATGKTAGGVNDNQFTNVVLQLGTGGASSVVARCIMIGAAAAPPNAIIHTGTGALNLQDINLRGTGTIELLGSGPLTWAVSDMVASTVRTVSGHGLTGNGNKLGGSQIILDGTGGTSSIIQLDAQSSFFTRLATQTGGTFSINRVKAFNANLAPAAGTTNATYSLTDSYLNGVTAPVRNQTFFTNRAEITNCQFTFGVGSNRQLSIVDSKLYKYDIASNRTGGPQADVIIESLLFGRSAVTALTLSGAVVAAAQNILSGCTVADGAVVNVTDPTGQNEPTSGVNTVFSNSEFRGTGTVVTAPAGAVLTQGCRFAAGAQVNVGAFSHVNTIVDGAFVKTFTAANINRLKNKSFDDTV